VEFFFSKKLVNNRRRDELVPVGVLGTVVPTALGVEVADAVNKEVVLERNLRCESGDEKPYTDFEEIGDDDRGEDDEEEDEEETEREEEEQDDEEGEEEGEEEFDDEEDEEESSRGEDDGEESHATEAAN